MSEPRPKLVVTKRDLNNPAIDRVLAAQYVPSYAPVEAKTVAKSGFLYATWFYMLLAGVVGAFLAWAIIEPKFSDELEMTGEVQSVSPEETPKDFYHDKYKFRGRIVVARVPVYAMEGVTQLLDEQGKPLSGGFSGLIGAKVVDVEGVRAPDETSMIATTIKRSTEQRSSVTDVKLDTLEATHTFWSVALFPLVAALIGLTVGAAEGLVCRTFGRALLCGSVGLLSGLVGGFLAVMVAGLIYSILGAISGFSAPTDSAGLFALQIFRRGLAWSVAGLAMGLGQGIALKSGRLILNGLIGGLVGGLMGGLLFDPINLLIAGKDLSHGAEVSRAVGIVIIGAAVGAMIGITELLTRDAWLRVLLGPLRGKEFSFSRTPIRIGSSPKNEIYLFKDERIDPVHAEIHSMRDTYELVDRSASGGTFVNGTRVTRHRLADGDTITIGGTQFGFSTRERRKDR